MPVQVPCVYTGCNYTTAQLPDGENAAASAVELLKLHITAEHRIIAPAKKEKAKLPILLVTEEALGMFKQQLTSYKRLAGLTSSTSADTVLQGLPHGAYQILFSRYGEDLITKTETEVLTYIKELLVRSENKLSYILKLLRLKQDSGQTVPIFAATLRAAAHQCALNITCQCGHTLSFAENLVFYQFLAGLDDADVQADLLADRNLTLEKAEKYACDKEMARRSQDVLVQETGEINHMRSSYQKGKKTPFSSDTMDFLNCSWTFKTI